MLLSLPVVFFPGSKQAEDFSVAPAPRAAVPLVTADKVAARAAIEKANAAWLAAFRGGDFAVMASLYSDDASLTVSGTDQLAGRSDILGFLKRSRGRGMSEPFLKTLDVVTMGNVAYETGTYRFMYGTGDSLVVGETGKYFVVWKAGNDGIWRYNLGTWTSNSPSSATR